MPYSGEFCLWLRSCHATIVLPPVLHESSTHLSSAGTPSLRDIIFHTQWCAALAMVAVQWPMFTCKSNFFRVSPRRS